MSKCFLTSKSRFLCGGVTSKVALLQTEGLNCPCEVIIPFVCCIVPVPAPREIYWRPTPQVFQNMILFGNVFVIDGAKSEWNLNRMV